MKKMILNTPEQMLFDLLKAALHQTKAEQANFQSASDEDWKLCYRLAVRQGVMALAWDGVETLPDSLQPSRNLKLSWALAVEAYEKKYAYYCRTVHELSAFYAEKGITTVQLKGVGLSTLYPIPSHREGGDVDIYTFSADHRKLTDAEANSLADELMVEQGLEVEKHSYKHSNFFYKGIPIENHKFFLNVQHYPIARPVNEWLKNNLHPEATVLSDGKCHVLTPSVAFNTMFLAFHASQHFGSGIALHHLCDWAVLINRFGVQYPSELIDKRFEEAIAAFTHLCNCYLGTQVPIAGGEELAEEVLQEILHPKFPHKEAVSVKGKLNIFIYKTRRFLHGAKVSNRILYIPFWKRVWMSIVAHLRRPETIFQTAP